MRNECGVWVRVCYPTRTQFTPEGATSSQLLNFSTPHLLNYSYFRESTGFERATLNDFALTTSKAIANTSAPGRTKSHQ